MRKRGLLRLWIVLSVGWVLAVGAVSYQRDWLPREQAATAQNCADMRKENPKLGNPFDCFEGLPRKDLFADLIPIRSAIVRFAVLAVAFPFSTMVLFLTGLWVVRGFASEKKS